MATSRHELKTFSRLELDTLDESLSQQLFYKYYILEKDDHSLGQILSRIGNHTLTIELLAKTAQKRQLSILSLAGDLERCGLNIKKTAKVVSNHDKGKHPSIPYDYLLSIFSLSEISSVQENILRYFTVLPAIFIAYNDLKKLFQIGEDDNVFFENLHELTARGWLKNVGQQFFAHQIIQEVLKEKLKPEVDGCLTLLVSIVEAGLQVEWGRDPLKVSNTFMLFAESLCGNLDNGINIEIARLCNLIGLRLEDSLNLTKALYFHRKALAIFENNAATTHDDLSCCYNNLQSVYKTLGDIDRAFDYQSKAINVQEKFSDPLDIDLGTSYNNISLLYQIKGDLRSAVIYQLKSIDIAEFNLESDHPHLVSAYSNYSLLLHELEEYDEALAIQKKVLAIRKASLEDSHPQMAESYSNLAAMYQAVGNLDEAEEHLIISINLREKLFPEGHHSLGVSYNNLASIHIERKDFPKAEKAQYTALKIEEDLLGKQHFTVAVTHSTMAVIQHALGNKQAARLSIEAAIAIAKKSFPHGHPDLDIYKIFLRDVLK